MQLTQFIMIGGFLGAGKTTAIARLARQFVQAGRQVGLVTNDQSHDLVDTQSLRAQGFSVGEVPGACFCCKFDELVATLVDLGRERRPDVILAEPVGSCTDLVATVLKPLQQWHDTEFRVEPLIVLLKPEHGRKILGAHNQGGFSAKAGYIFLKQIEEAQILALNKIDKLPPAESKELVDLVKQKFPDKTVIPVSARTGTGFQELQASLSESSLLPSRSMPIDYNLYAEGEAELGWLNGTIHVKSFAEELSLDQLVHDFLSHFKQSLEDHQAEPAHLKVLAQNGDVVSVGNLVDSNSAVELSWRSEAVFHEARLTVNARVLTDPAILESILRELVAQISNDQIVCSIDRIDYFRPAPPTPTHRLTP